MKFTFSKDERLKSRKAIENVIHNGRVNFLFPFRMVWCTSQTDQKSPARIAFAVPKKKFKNATDRNLLKRRMREAYRLNKHLFYPSLRKNNISIDILLVYIGNEILSGKEIEERTIQIFKVFMEDQ